MRLWLAVLGCSGALWPSAAHAFGKEGHEIVACIAYETMAPKTRIKINRLLSGKPGMVGPELMMDAAFRPDYIKEKAPGTPVNVFANFDVRDAAQTHPLHYADMAADRYDPRTDSERGESVVSAIERCREVLGSAQFSPEQKQEATKFLLHFVGDIHQPLHAGRKADRGGNDIAIVGFLNQHPRKGFNLHEVWDSLIIQAEARKEKDRDAQAFATALLQRTTKATIKRFRREKDPHKWLDESHRLALSRAYVDSAGRPLANGALLGQDYFDKNEPVIEEQLTKAGVRLAAMLDDLIK